MRDVAGRRTKTAVGASSSPRLPAGASRAGARSHNHGRAVHGWTVETTSRGFRSICASLIALALGVTTTAAVAAERALDRASAWLGHAVVTPDGEEVGTVRDLALDPESGRVVYFAVSVGSFLIENNLIAVAPDALTPAATEEAALVLEADTDALRRAARFSMTGRWPQQPDVERATAARPATHAPAPVQDGAAESPAPPVTGSATIESRTKTARLSATERVITETAPPAPAAAPARPPADTSAGAAPGAGDKGPFERLDRDGDGVLNRSEFAHQMTRTDHYSNVDIDANGVIDRGEYDVFAKGRTPAP